MPEPSVSSIAIYQLRVVLCGVSPLVWRRLLVVSTTSIAELHEILQNAFSWSGEHLHRFLIHGAAYGIPCLGGIALVVTIGEDGCQETLEIACVERTDLKPETLGLTLAESKMILNDLQQIVVERQVSSSLLLKQACPDCGQRRRSKGNHTLSLRTVFGQLTVRSPRLHHCVCRPHDTKTFSPLAELLPNHTLPELLFLETKWASLMSYGMTSKLLQDVLPIDEPVNTFTIRQHVEDVAERLEQEMGDEQLCFVEGCQRSWDELPA